MHSPVSAEWESSSARQNDTTPTDLASPFDDGASSGAMATTTRISGRHHRYNDEVTEDHGVGADYADNTATTTIDNPTTSNSRRTPKTPELADRSNEITWRDPSSSDDGRERQGGLPGRPSGYGGTIGGWVPEKPDRRVRPSVQESAAGPTSPHLERVSLPGWFFDPHCDPEEDCYDPAAASVAQGRRGIGRRLRELSNDGETDPPEFSGSERVLPIGGQQNVGLPEGGRDHLLLAPAEEPVPLIRSVPVSDGADGIQDRIESAVDNNAQDSDGGDTEAISNSSGTAPAARARRIGRHWGRFAELWVPESLREARVDPGRRGALVLLLVATLAATVTAVGVWRDRPESRPVETSAITDLAVAPVSANSNAGREQTPQPAVAASPAGPQDSPVPAQPAELVVSVTGLVAKPGLVTLPAGARVADAIAAAGGIGPEADLTGMNLAARLSDGDSVVIGSSIQAAGIASSVASSQGSNPAATAGAGAAPSSELINLNAADEAALDTLPGVGPVMAQNILAWRQTNGSFTNIEQLQEISGIGPSRYAQIAPLVTVS